MYPIEALKSQIRNAYRMTDDRTLLRIGPDLSFLFAYICKRRMYVRDVRTLPRVIGREIKTRSADRLAHFLAVVTTGDRRSPIAKLFRNQYPTWINFSREIAAQRSLDAQVPGERKKQRKKKKKGKTGDEKWRGTSRGRKLRKRGDA